MSEERIYVVRRRVPPERLREWLRSRETELPNLTAGYEEGRGEMFMMGPFSRSYLESLKADWWTFSPEVASEDIRDP